MLPATGGQFAQAVSKGNHQQGGGVAKHQVLAEMGQMEEDSKDLKHSRAGDLRNGSLRNL